MQPAEAAGGAVTVQCEGCGRVRVDGVGDWVFDREAPVGVIGMCATCGAIRGRRQDLAYYRNARDVERRAATGRLRSKMPKDAFKGFR